MRATVIYTGEPVWGGVVGRLAGDRLPPLAFVGAGLIVLGVLVGEVRMTWPRRRAADSASVAVVPVIPAAPVGEMGTPLSHADAQQDQAAVS
jgi:hypothetical protein